MKKDKLIIFDLDGTLYKFKDGTFVSSGLQKQVLKNAIKYIQFKLKKTKKEAQKILNDIVQNYGEDISIAMEEKYNCTRRDYFDFVWDIDAKNIITGSQDMSKILRKLDREYKLALISDGAFIWIQNALIELNLIEFFEGNIFSGDGQKRKSLKNRFNDIPKQYSVLPKNIISIGDQEKTDIIPAKQLGFKTIFVSNSKKTTFADVNIDSIKKCEKAINKLFKK